MSLAFFFFSITFPDNHCCHNDDDVARALHKRLIVYIRNSLEIFTAAPLEGFSCRAFLCFAIAAALPPCLEVTALNWFEGAGCDGCDVAVASGEAARSSSPVDSQPITTAKVKSLRWRRSRKMVLLVQPLPTL